jgi:eukaryotic-like serine/threonine-protein kinase
MNQPEGEPGLRDPSSLYKAPEAGGQYSYADTLGTAIAVFRTSDGHSLMSDSSQGDSSVDWVDKGYSTRQSVGARIFPDSSQEKLIDASRFKILKVLGEGAAGRVYLAFDSDIGREVAIKFYRGAATGLSEDIAREIRISGRVVHPGVTPVYDVGQGDDGEYYCVMKHLVGCTLGDLIERLRAGDQEVHTRFTFLQRANMIVQLLRVLVATHKLGIIHRDIKPENIVIGPVGDLSLIDWSIALDTSEGDGSGTVCGTPSHMAPEQAMGAATDERTDVYGVAATFYELLCLDISAPEVGSDLVSLLTAIPKFIPRRVDSVQHHSQGYVPSEYADLLERALARDPKDRYPNALSMLQALEQIQNGRFQATCPRTSIKSRLHRLMRWLDLNPHRNVSILWTGIVGTAIVLVVLGITIGNLIGM